MKRLVLCILILALLPLYAIGEGNSLPVAVGEQIARMGLGQVVSAAVGWDISGEKDAVLALARRQEGYALVGLEMENGQITNAQSFGDLGLMLNDDCAIAYHSLNERHKNGRFLLSCSSETWEFQLWKDWFVAGYDGGSGPIIRWDNMGVFYLNDTFRYVDASTYWPACVCTFLPYLDDLSFYPKTVEEMTRLAQNSFQSFQGWGVVHSAQLRSDPASRSHSQGQLGNAVLAQVITQQPGKDEPWYYVRVGDLTGWVSGPYVHLMNEQPADYALHLCYGLKRGETLRPGSLYDAPDGQAVMELPVGRMVHVLLTREDGWVYASVPTTGDAFFMDPYAPTGWILESELRKLPG